MVKIEYPIYQATMTHAGGYKLAAAVSEAGGLGVIMPNGGYSAQWLDEQITLAKKATNAPFAVALFQRPWFVERMFLRANRFNEYAMENLERGKKDVQEQLKVILDHKIQVVYLLGDDPHANIKRELKKIDAYIIAKVHNIEWMKGSLERGADAVLLKGHKAAGYAGYQSLEEMMRIAREQGVPFIASGGIEYSQQVKDCLNAGAFAVQIGTRFTCAEECDLHENYKNEIICSISSDVMLSHDDFDCPIKPTRAIVNNRTGKWIIEHNKVLARFKNGEIDKIEAQILLKRLACKENPVASWSEDLYKAAVLGDIENGVVMVGTGIDSITKVEPAKEIMEVLTDEL